MPILLGGTIEFAHIEQVSSLFTFRFEQVLLYTDQIFSVHYISLICFNFATFYSVLNL
jgi:hypothetical protein